MHILVVTGVRYTNMLTRWKDIKRAYKKYYWFRFAMFPGWWILGFIIFSVFFPRIGSLFVFLGVVSILLAGIVKMANNWANPTKKIYYDGW